MNDEKRYDEPQYEGDMVSEPAVAAAYHAAPCAEPEIPYDVDFGYPRTVEELKAEVERAVSERNDSSKWMTNEEFWTEMKRDLSWL